MSREKKESRAYQTKQRAAILALLTQCRAHMTADDIVRQLQERGLAVGKSTVYRYLDKLIEQGSVRRYVIEEGMPACYEYCAEADACSSHYHLKCTQCGRLLHVECETLRELNAHVRQHHGFLVDGSKTVLYGLCAHCAESGAEAPEHK